MEVYLTRMEVYPRCDPHLQPGKFPAKPLQSGKPLQLGVRSIYAIPLVMSAVHAGPWGDQRYLQCGTCLDCLACVQVGPWGAQRHLQCQDLF
eukprot:scaffold155508_cov17-Tisochrysis_lutea.AAC.1